MGILKTLFKGTVKSTVIIYCITVDVRGRGKSLTSLAGRLE
jgi:hypothetical protein